MGSGGGAAGSGVASAAAVAGDGLGAYVDVVEGWAGVVGVGWCEVPGAATRVLLRYCSVEVVAPGGGRGLGFLLPEAVVVAVLVLVARVDRKARSSSFCGGGISGCSWEGVREKAKDKRDKGHCMRKMNKMSIPHHHWS